MKDDLTALQLGILALAFYALGFITGFPTGTSYTYQKAYRAGAGKWSQRTNGDHYFQWFSETRFVEPVIQKQHDKEFHVHQR